MSECETANKFAKQKKKKKRKYKLIEAENMPESILGSNETLNSTVQHHSMEYKEPDRCETESSRKKKKTDLEIIESTNDEKSDFVNSNKFYKKKKKHKVKNNEDLSGYRIFEMHLQDSKNNTSIEIPEKFKHRKKHKLESLYKTGNVSCTRIKESCKAENEIILDELYKRKKHKQKEFNSMPDYLSADLNGIELSQNNLNNKNYKWKERHKCVTGNQISDVESNHISYNAVYYKDVEESNLENLERKSNLKLSKKNRHSEIKAKTHQKRKHENINDINEFDCKIIEPSITEKLDDSINSIKFHKKKRKHKITDDKNLSECEISEKVIQKLENDTDIKFLKYLRKQRRKIGKHNLGEMENVFIHQKSATDESEKNRIVDVLDIQKRKNKHKQIEVGRISNCEILQSGAVELNQNGSNKKNADKCIDKKKKKHKSFNKIENMSNEIACSNFISIGENNSMGENISKVHQKKKEKYKSFDTKGEISDCKVEIMPETVIELNNTSSNIYCEHTKMDKVKSVQNLAADIFTKTNKEKVEKTNEMFSDTLQEKKNNVGYKGSVLNTEVAYSSFDPFINNMSDVPVLFPVPVLHESEVVCSITLEKRAYLEKNGVIIQTGKWTKTEDDILTRNFQQFGLEFGVNDPFQLLGINQAQKNNQLEKFKKAKHFLIRLGKDLNNRSLRSIYMRARKLLTPLKIQKKLSPEETANLKHAHQLVGNKWTKISDMLSRSDNTCHTAFRWHKSDINKGKWTPEEECNLIKAIKTVSKSEDISFNKVKNISWKAVAKYIPTRNEFQCHKQWAEHLAWDSSVTEKKCWDRYYYGKLIYLLKEKYCFNSEHEIDWKELHKHFIDVAPSYIFLHKKWFYLKGRLPKNLDLSYSKCLDFLKRMYEKEYGTFIDA